jgi:RNA polymerase sigma factor (sigma-70 family)
MNVNPTDDAALLAAALDGEQLAFNEIYLRYRAPCASVIRRVLVRPEGVDDVIQTTFLSVWRHAASYDSSKGSVATWILTIAHHRAVDEVRRDQLRAGRDTGPIGIDALTAAAPGPEELAVLVDAGDHLESAMTLLSTKVSTVMRLAYFEGLSQTQIARELGVPLGTVKSRVREGLRQLRRQLDRS